MSALLTVATLRRRTALLTITTLRRLLIVTALLTVATLRGLHVAAYSDGNGVITDGGDLAHEAGCAGRLVAVGRGPAVAEAVASTALVVVSAREVPASSRSIVTAIRIDNLRFIVYSSYLSWGWR